MPSNTVMVPSPMMLATFLDKCPAPWGRDAPCPPVGEVVHEPSAAAAAAARGAAVDAAAAEQGQRAPG
eukprot:1114416-Pyramimonas_sp.AAC.1